MVALAAGFESSAPDAAAASSAALLANATAVLFFDRSTCSTKCIDCQAMYFHVFTSWGRIPDLPGWIKVQLACNLNVQCRVIYFLIIFPPLSLQLKTEYMTIQQYAVLGFGARVAQQ